MQASFEVQYYTQTGSSISDWKTITGTTDATATIPASDLAGVERVTWRVRLTSDDGVVGEWSDWEYCTCVNKSGKATALSPDGASVTAGETVMFLWEHSSTSGLGRAAVQIQMQARRDGLHRYLHGQHKRPAARYRAAEYDLQHSRAGRMARADEGHGGHVVGMVDPLSSISSPRRLRRRLFGQHGNRPPRRGMAEREPDRLSGARARHGRE